MCSHERGLWALRNTQEYSWYHGTIFMSAHEVSWMLLSSYKCFWSLMKAPDWSRVSSAWFNNKQKILTFKMTSLYYFGNNLIQVSPINKKMDIFKIYTERAVEKCPRWIFETPRKPRNLPKTRVSVFFDSPCIFQYCLFLMPRRINCNNASCAKKKNRERKYKPTQ